MLHTFRNRMKKNSWKDFGQKWILENDKLWKPLCIYNMHIHISS